MQSPSSVPLRFAAFFFLLVALFPGRAGAVAEAAIAPAMISACTSRLCARASIKPARNCDRYRMLVESASRPARLSDRIRRVRLEKLSVKKN